MSDAPAVSVLLPVRDAGSFLEPCLSSLARQTLGDLEVVMVDDGSRDGSGQRLQEWARRDARFRVVRQDPSGIVQALNAGLERCRAPLIARMDADDLCHPRRLELQVELLRQHPEVAVLSCRVCHVPRHGLGEGTRLYEQWLNGMLSDEHMLRERFIESPVAHPSVMIRRQALEHVGGYRDRGWPEDYDLWLRLFQHHAVFAKLPQVLLFWREHPGRLTRCDQRYAHEQLLRAKAHFLAAGPLASRPPTILCGAGKTGRRLARFLREEGLQLSAVVDVDPNKTGHQLAGAPIVSPQELSRLLTPATVVLAAVGLRGVRQQLRSFLQGLGLVEGRSFWCVA